MVFVVYIIEPFSHNINLRTKTFTNDFFMIAFKVRFN